MKIGQQIREARLSLGWTQARLSVESAVGIVTVGRIERDEFDGALVILRRVADAVGLSVDVSIGPDAEGAAA